MKRKHVLVLSAVLLLIVGGGVAGWLLWQRRIQSTEYQLGRLKGEINIQLRLGDRTKAVELLEEYLALDPSDLDRGLTLASLYDGLGDPAKAERLLRELLAKNPEELRAVLALAQNLNAKQRLAEAWALIGPRLEAEGEQGETKVQTDLWILGGRLHARLGRVEKGLKLLRRAAKQRESFGLRQLDTGDQRVAALLAQGQVLLAAGRTQEAEAALRKAYSVADDGVVVCRLLSGILRGSNRIDEGEKILRKLYQLRADEPQIVAPFLADYLVAVGKPKAALALAVELEAKDERGQGIGAYIRGVMAQRQGRASEGLKHFRAMARLLPASSQAHLMMAGQALAVGDLKLARSALEQTLSLQPGSAGAELGLLELDERAGDDAAAEVRALRLLGISAARPRALRTLLALHRRSPKDTAAAVQSRLVEVLKDTPNDVTAQLYLAVFRLLGGDVKGGAAALAKLADTPTVDLQRSLGLVAAAQAGSTDLLEAVELLSEVAEQDPKLASAREVLAALYIRLGRHDLARKELDAALAVRVRPASTAARARLAMSDSDRPRARRELTALLTKAPDDINLLRALAILAFRAEDLPEARKLVARAVQRAPKDAGLQALRGRVLVLVGLTGEGRKAYAEARRLAPKFSRGYEDGLSLLLSGDPVKARKRFADGLRLTRDPRLAGALAAVLAERGKVGAALKALQGVGRGGPETALLRVHLLQLGGDIPSAKRLAERLRLPREVLAAVRVLDVDRRAWMYRSYALGVLGWRSELRALARTLSQRERDPCLLWWSFRAFEPKRPEHLAFAKRLAAVATQEPIASLWLADAYLGADQRAKEVACLRQLAGRFPEDGAVALRLGMSLERDKRPEEAITQYAKAVERAKGMSQAIAHNNLAYQLAATPERRERAIEHARQAARGAPRSGRVQDTLGWVLFRAGRLGEAQTHLARAVSMEPSIPTLRYHLAALLERRGDRRRALRHLRTALLSRATFKERPDAEALAKRLEGEEALLASSEEQPKLTALGAHTGRIGKDGHAVVRLALRAREVSLIFKGAAGTELALFQRRELRLRMRAGAKGGRTVPRLRVPARGAVVLHGAAGSEFSITLAEGDPSVGDVEPNDTPDQALPLRTEKTLIGSFHGPADRDLVRLKLPPGSAGLEVEALEQPAWVELLRSHPAGDEVLKAFRLTPGQPVSVGPLREDRRDDWFLRLAPAGDAGRYQLRLNSTKVAGDPEPNDRAQDAVPAAVNATVAGRLGPGDGVDWHRLVGDPTSAVVKIELSAAGGPGLVLRLWRRAPTGVTPIKVYRVGQEPLTVERWRLRPGAELLFEVRAASVLKSPLTYTLAIKPGVEAKAGEETEPNDRAATAEKIKTELSGALEEGDVDWIAPGELAGRHLALELTWGSGPLRVGVFSERGRLVGSFGGQGGTLSVPRIALPGGRVLLALQSRSGAGAYRLRVSGAKADPGLEVEPNDDLTRASPVHSRLGLSGQLNGAEDRDLIKLLSARALTIRATGVAAIQAQLTQGSGKSIRVEPGKSIKIPAEDLSQAAPYLELTRPKGTSGVATYVLTQEP